jgi:hypothetical protein
MTRVTMARFNVFEESRRMALLVKVLWVIGALAIGWTNSPFVSMKFATLYPDSASIRNEEDCEIGTDAMEFISRSLDDGKSVSLTPCFRALRAESGARVVPYKVEKF